MPAPRKPLTALSLFLLGGLVAGAALAADMPKRKSGLWEMKTQMEGMPSPGPMQMCVDQNTDNLMQDKARAEKVNCSAMDVKQAGGRTTIHSVCKHEGTTVTTDGIITGDFASGYRSDMKMRYSPAQEGMKDMHVIQEAKWLGPCKPGQKAGDIIMPGMAAGVNMQQMMNSAQMQEMMKRQRQAR